MAHRLAYQGAACHHGIVVKVVHLGAGRRRDHGRRGRHDSGGGRQAAEDGLSRNSDTAAPRSRIGRVELSTGEQDFAADSLQVQQT
jgi:hypothetical protein